MKDQKKIHIDGVASSSSSSSNTTTNNNTNHFNLLLRGTNAVTIRKNNNNGGPHNQDLVVLRRRLKEYILYSKLKSLIPPQPCFDVQHFGIRQDIHGDNEEELATEVEMELNEIPADQRDSDEEIDHTTTSSSSIVGLKNVKLVIQSEEEDGDDEEENEHTIVEFESEDDDDEEEERENGSSLLLKPFVPSIKIQKMEDTILINTIVLKEVALSSALFRILEDEKLDIVSENQYRTETKVAHTIQVKVESEYKIDELEKKLQKWARCSS